MGGYRWQPQSIVDPDRHLNLNLSRLSTGDRLTSEQNVETHLSSVPSVDYDTSYPVLWSLLWPLLWWSPWSMCRVAILVRVMRLGTLRAVAKGWRCAGTRSACQERSREMAISPLVFGDSSPPYDSRTTTIRPTKCLPPTPPSTCSPILLSRHHFRPVHICTPSTSACLPTAQTRTSKPPVEPRRASHDRACAFTLSLMSVCLRDL